MNYFLVVFFEYPAHVAGVMNHSTINKTTQNHTETSMPTSVLDANSSKPTYDPQYAIYKANNRGAGSVVRLGLSCAKSCVFLEAANQCGERQFDWDGKIVMKWGMADLGAVLSALQGRESEVKLFHRTEKADTALNLTRQDVLGGQNRQSGPGRAPYLLSVSQKSNANGSSRRVSIPISHAEASVLEAILRSAITRILQW